MPLRHSYGDSEKTPPFCRAANLLKQADRRCAPEKFHCPFSVFFYLHSFLRAVRSNAKRLSRYGRIYPNLPNKENSSTIRTTKKKSSSSIKKIRRKRSLPKRKKIHPISSSLRGFVPIKQAAIFELSIRYLTEAVSPPRFSTLLFSKREKSDRRIICCR